MSQKPKVAIFDFTGCEGCELNKLNFENHLIDIITHIDIVEWREAMDDKVEEYDIAFVEGSISTPECVKRIHDIRSRSKVLVALGACAVNGGMNAMKNKYSLDIAKEAVYGKDKNLFPTLPALPLSSYVRVDYQVYGCPMTQDEFLRLVTSLLMGKKPVQPDYSVCVECKLSENECVYGKGLICMGPITRAGCNALCPAFGQYCIGCRGLVPHANKEAMISILTENGLSLDDARKRIDLYNSNDKERVLA